jgi:hypothetical protein
MVPDEGRMMEDLSLCCLVAERCPELELLPDERPLPEEPERLLPDDPLLPEERPLLACRLPVLLCFFWVVFFDFCPLLRRAVDACFMA